jgi:hypothetical protein
VQGEWNEKEHYRLRKEEITRRAVH